MILLLRAMHKLTLALRNDFPDAVEAPAAYLKPAIFCDLPYSYSARRWQGEPFRPHNGIYNPT